MSKYTALDAAVDGDEAATAELAALRRDVEELKAALIDALDWIDPRAPKGLENKYRVLSYRQ